MIHFLDPVLLYLLIPLAILFVLWLGTVAIKLIKRPQRTYGSKYPLIGKTKLWGLFAIPVAALMVLAMAKPSLNRSSFNPSRGDIEVIMVIDRSISMRADDIKPTRLDTTKREAANIGSLLVEGDKVALFVFGQESHKKIYLSDKFENTFDRLARISFPTENLYGDGLIWDSDFATMLENIYQSMDRQDAHSEGYSADNYSRYVPKKRTNRVVIIFSDGEDQFRKMKPTTKEETTERDDYLKRLNGALSEFRRRGLKIYPVGVGTEKGVKWLSLLRGFKSGQGYYAYLDKDWENGISRIDKENFMFLARSTGVQLGGDNIWTVENNTTTVRDYLSHIIGLNRKVTLEFGQAEDNQDLWQYFLMAAVGILGLAIVSHPVSGYFKRKRKI